MRRLGTSVLVVLVVVFIDCAWALSVTGRRQTMAGASALLARGAFELDAEYYARSLLGLDKDRDVFDRREPLKTPEAFAICSVDETFATEVLTLAARCARSVAPNFDYAAPSSLATSDAVSAATFDFYERAARALATREKRERFQRLLGEALLPLSSKNADQGLLVGARAVLETWKTHGWIESGTVSFADGDDDDDDPRPLQVTLRRPATAPAFADLEKQGQLWHPSFVGCALGAYFSDSLQQKKDTRIRKFDEYLLDDTYRTDPRAFRASSLLLLFALDTSPLEY